MTPNTVPQTATEKSASNGTNSDEIGSDTSVSSGLCSDAADTSGFESNASGPTAGTVGEANDVIALIPTLEQYANRCKEALSSRFPADIKLVLEKDGKKFGVVKYKPYYETKRFLKLKKPDSDYPLVVTPEEGVEFGYKLRAKGTTKSRKFQYCPYCNTRMRSDNLKRHMHSTQQNGEIIPPSCKKRREEEPMIDGIWHRAKKEPLA